MKNKIDTGDNTRLKCSIWIIEIQTKTTKKNRLLLPAILGF